MEMNEKRHSFRETTKQLLNAIVVIYAGHFGLFHKTTTLKHFRATGAEALPNDLQAMFQNAWQRLPDFCKLPKATRHVNESSTDLLAR